VSSIYLEGKNITHSSAGIGVLVETGGVSEAYYQDVKSPHPVKYFIF
jgi:hypothetical protein